MGIALPFVDILIFAIIAIFLGLRLRNILGTRDGYEQTPDELGQKARHNPLAEQPVDEADEKIVPLRPTTDSATGSATGSGAAMSGDGINAIKKADPSFDTDQFAQGAAMAFGMVLTAYAEGDLSQLRRLLGYDLFNEFSDAIRDRNADNESLSLVIDSIDDIQILDGNVSDGIASVTVRIVSQQTRRIFDMSGDEIIDESADHQPEIDVWTFERDTQIADPNWKLVETSSEGGDDD